MHKIAILFNGDYEQPRGAFNATLNRIKYLIALNQYKIDVFLLSSYSSPLVNLLRRTQSVDRKESVVIDGIQINLIWVPFTLVDYACDMFLNLPPLVKKIFSINIYKRFKDYDLISCHSSFPGDIVMKVKDEFHIPYAITWHGSDIHTLPHINKSNFRLAKSLIEKADANFFVSKKLLEQSNEITTTGYKLVLYNGVDKSKFHPFSEDQKENARKLFNINNNCKNIAFVGNFIEIKNVLCLPEVFDNVQKTYEKDVHFYFVGSGKYEERLKRDCENRHLNSSFIIDCSSDNMPAIYNAMDLIVLPSKNEGLPLVCVEALACGTPMVGSNVGGISEVIGKENTVELDSNFITDLSSLILSKITETASVVLPKQFDWKQTAYNEFNIYNKILS